MQRLLCPQIKALVFDLDNTLVRSDDLKNEFRGVRYTTPQGDEYIQKLSTAIASKKDRMLISPAWFTRTRRMYPGLKLGILTRAPMTYTDTMLKVCYPDVKWNGVITYESVNKTKPDPEGLSAMVPYFGLMSPREMALVGDDATDIMAAYREGCQALWFRGVWPDNASGFNFAKARELMPDYQCRTEQGLDEFLQAPYSQLLPMEKYLALYSTGIEPWTMMESDFLAGATKHGGGIIVLSRYFTDHKQFANIRSYHATTPSMIRFKEHNSLKKHWLPPLWMVVSALIAQHETRHIVTVIPAKSQRPPRMETLLEHLENFSRSTPSPIPAKEIPEFVPNALMFSDGARSHHGEHLSRDERKRNTEKHLQLSLNFNPTGRNIIVIDDVVTSGATLLTAKNLLMAKGASSVHLVAISQTVSGKRLNEAPI